MRENEESSDKVCDIVLRCPSYPPSNLSSNSLTFLFFFYCFAFQRSISCSFFLLCVRASSYASSEYKPSHLLDHDTETCWTSKPVSVILLFLSSSLLLGLSKRFQTQAGTDQTQWLLCTFEEPVTLKSVGLMFHAGFTPKVCSLFVSFRCSFFSSVR
jgi:hypothetical protein